MRKEQIIGQDVKITLITGIIIEGKLIETFCSPFPFNKKSYKIQTSDPAVAISVGEEVIKGFEIKKREEIIYAD